MIRNVRNPHGYIAKAVENYRADCVAGFPDEWAAKQAFWQVALCVFEVAPEAERERWIAQLQRIAQDHLKPGQVRSTLKSAAARARRE
jgi:hypothetical protein